MPQNDSVDLLVVTTIYNLYSSLCTQCLFLNMNIRQIRIQMASVYLSLEPLYRRDIGGFFKGFLR